MIATPKFAQLLAARTLKNCKDDECLPALKRSIETHQPPRKKLFSADDICLIRKDFNLSTRQTLVLTQDLRKAAVCNPRSVIEPSVKKMMYEKNHELDYFFEYKTLKFTRNIETQGKKYSELFDQHVVTTNDISKLIEKIILHRSLNEENVFVRVGLDGGGGFLKVCLSLFDLTASPSKNVLAKKFKDSGVKKVIIIGITPNVPENYVNVKKLWLSIGLQSMQKSFTIATDLKLCNILLGLMSHSSMHPCCWCDIDKHNLDKKGTQRTFASLSNLFWDYFGAQGTKANAKNYGNAIHPSIIGEMDDSTPVLTIVPPPELHLLLGPVNHLYNEINKVWPQSEDWLKSCFVKKSEYHGGSFEGNDCRKLLKNTNLLRELCPKEHEQYVNTFSFFNDLVSSCYGLELHPTYKANIAKFKKEFLKLKISVTPKIHAVLPR